MFLARAAIGGVIAFAVFALRGEKFLPPAERVRFVVVALGVIILFPLFIALALQRVPSSHAAVVTGILPLATAIAGAFFLGERHGILFWVSAIAGSGVVTLFSLWKSGGNFSSDDFYLLLSVISAAVGYAEGGRLARIYGGPAVISWCLIGFLPASAMLVGITFRAAYLDAPLSAWGGLFYTGIFSVYLGFFAWYRGLSEGGVGRVGQVQLLQPFLTLLFSGWLFGERIEPVFFFTALLVAFFILIGRFSSKPRSRR